MRRFPATTTSSARGLWLAPLAFLGAVGLGTWIVFARPLTLFGVVLVVLAAVPVAWVLVSALLPAKAERGCPACKADALARSDPLATHGLVCRACGWSDESASAWLLAEEEGPLEELVLAARRRPVRGRPVRARPAPAVDSPQELH
jgi:hypothetical protein